jgi:tetratricopeptide (TPR) repeat protein
MLRRHIACCVMMALLSFLGAASALADASRNGVEDSDWGEVEYIGNSDWIRRIGNMNVEYLGNTDWIRRIGPYDVEYLGNTYWIRRIGPYDVEYLGNTDWIRRIGNMNVEYIGNTYWIKYIGNRKAAASATTPRGNVQTAIASSSLPPAGLATPTAAAGPAREPIEPISRLGRGVQLHGEKDFQQALQQLLVAAQSDPNDPRVYVYLADTYGWLGMDAEAKQAAERAKQLDPNAFEILR